MKAIHSDELKAVHLRKMLRRYLEESEAVDPNGLAERLDVERSELNRELESMLAVGEVEILRPVGATENTPGIAGRERYRLIRPTDKDFLWEQKAVLTPRVSWAATVRGYIEQCADAAGREYGGHAAYAHQVLNG